jgi:hypothetical protein
MSDNYKWYKECIGKTIESIRLEDNVLRFKFADGTKLTVRDDGQSCCEHRYMTCDDDLSLHYGEKLVSIETSGVKRKTDDDWCHDVMFLWVQTDKDSFSVCTHNSHNGYYGGFDIVYGE